MPADRDGEFRRIADEQVVARTTIATPAPGGTYDFTMKPNIERDMRDQTVVQAQQTIERRVNELGVAEPNISHYGSAQRSAARADAGRDGRRAREGDHPVNTALLELKIVEAGPAPTQGSAAPELRRQGPGRHGGRLRARRRSGDTGSEFYLVRKVAGGDRQDLRNAKPSIDENNRPAVSFSLTNEGSRKFGKVTGENIGRYLAIILDNRVVSAPRHRRQDHRRRPDQRRELQPRSQVADLSLKLRSGALPASLTYLEERVIGPSLGADSIRSGVLASLVGLVADRHLHARLLQGCRASTRSSR